MMNRRVLIEGIQVDITDDVYIPLSFSALNLSNISLTSSPFSKTVKAPRTKNNNRLFNHLFNVQTVGIAFSWNSKIKYKVESYINSELQFRGYVKMIDVDKDSYSIAFTSDINDFVTNRAEKKLEDLPPTLTSGFTHNMSYDNIVASWNNNEDDPASSYIYVLGNFAHEPKTHPSIAASNVYLSALRCSLFLKHYWDMIFQDAGFTYEGPFLETERFKRCLTPFKDGAYVGSGGYSITASNCDVAVLTGKTTNYNSPVSGVDVFKCEIDDTTDSYTIGSNPYYTAPVSSSYDVVIDMPSFGFRFNHNESSSKKNSLSNAPQKIWFVLEKYNSDFSTGTILPFSFFKEYGWNDIVGDVAMTNPSDVPGYTYQYDTGFSFTYTSPSVTVFLEEGEHLKVTMYMASALGGGGHTYLSWNGNDAVYDTLTSLKINDSTPLTVAKLKISTSLRMENGRVLYKDFCLKDVKQVDFISSVLKLFNLIIVPDKLKPKHFIIYTSDEFYKADLPIIDWTEKVARDQDIRVRPIPNLEDGYLRFGYKTDVDYFSTLYKAETGLTYGEKTVGTGYEFSDNTKDVLGNNIFSATLPVLYDTNQPIYCERSIEIVNSDKKKIYASGYNTIEGSDLPTDDSQFYNAKEGIQILLYGNTYTITKVHNPYYFEVDADVSDKPGGAVDGTYYAKFDVFRYKLTNDKILGIAVYDSKDNDATRTQIKVNPRVLYFQGKMPCNTWSLQYTPMLRGREYIYQDTTYRWNLDEYPVFSHLDSYSNPRFDLLFNEPLKEYYPITNYPSKNSGNFSNLYKNWENTVSEIVDNNARLLTCWMRLTQTDIANFDPRQKVYVDGVYWRVNKIIDYLSLPDKLTQVELIKCPDLVYYPEETSGACYSYIIHNYGGGGLALSYRDCDHIFRILNIAAGEYASFCSMTPPLITDTSLHIVYNMGLCEDEVDCLRYEVINTSETLTRTLYYVDCDDVPHALLLEPDSSRFICLKKYTAQPDITVEEYGECTETVPVIITNTSSTNDITSVSNIPGYIGTDTHADAETSKNGIRSLTSGTASLEVVITGSGEKSLQLYANETLIQCITVDGAGTYTFDPHSFTTTDVITVILFGYNVCDDDDPEDPPEEEHNGLVFIQNSHPSKNITNVVGITGLSLTFPIVPGITKKGFHNTALVSTTISVNLQSGATGKGSIYINGSFWYNVTASSNTLTFPISGVTPIAKSDQIRIIYDDDIEV